jgi:hypothetical protein
MPPSISSEGVVAPPGSAAFHASGGPPPSLPQTRGGTGMERNAVPATVPGSEHDGHVGVLRFDFGRRSERLEEVAWDEWLRTFAERELVFLFQEKLENGRQSNFFRLDSPHREDA